jgi:hypothetical protein
MEPDDLLPKTTWLIAVMPPPRFPAYAADDAFGRESVSGSRAEVATRSFAPIEAWGYQPIGRYEDRDNQIEAIAYTSESATVWVVFFGTSLLVMVTPESEHDPGRLNHHLAAAGGTRRVAAWGSFPVKPEHLPAAARSFLNASGDLLRGGAPDFKALSEALDAAANRFSRRVGMRASWNAAQGLARSGQHRAAVRALGYWEQDLTPEQRGFLDQERASATEERPPIERGGRSDREWFIARADHLNAAQAQLRRAFDQRDSSELARTAWSDAALELHDAVDLLYGDLEVAIQRAKHGDGEAVRDLVAFLEADPWCFRSGYTKGRIYELMRHVPADQTQLARIRSVLLMAVDSGYRREFRSACRLARQLADPALTNELRRRLADSTDPHIRRRALWMLSYVAQGLEGMESAVHDVLVETANYEEWWRVSRWVWELGRRFTTDDFASKIRKMALSNDEAEARRGLRLLAGSNRQPLDAGERLALEHIVLDAAQGRGPGTGLVESLAVVGDTKRLRRRLAELASSTESPVNRYAQWGLNAAVRANGDEAPDL